MDICLNLNIIYTSIWKKLVISFYDLQDLDAVEVEEHHVPINSGDSFQNASDNSIQQAASGTSTSDTSTIQSPSREIQEMKNTELRVSTTGHTPSHNSTQSTSNSFVVQPTTTSSNSNNLNQKSIPGSSTSVSTDITDFGSTKSDDKSENSDRRWLRWRHVSINKPLWHSDLESRNNSRFLKPVTNLNFFGKV